MTAEPTHTQHAGDVRHDTPAGCEFLMVDPAIVEIGPNTRTDVVLDAHFVADIRHRGVRSPIIVRRRASDGVLVLREGQRRLLAAVKVGHPQIRALVEPEPSPEIGENYPGRPDVEIERIVDQLGENLHRAEISACEEVRAHQELLDLGLTPAQIARRTHTKAARVRQTTAVAASELAAAVMGRYELDLMQLQVIAEFDDDPEAVKALVVITQQSPAQFEHVAQRLRDERAEQAMLEATVAALGEQGVTVINRGDYDDAASLDRLRPSQDDGQGTPLTEHEHRSCPGHAAELSTSRHWRDGTAARVTYVCLSPGEHGHYWRYNPTPASDGTGARNADGETEEDKAARQAERRRVIANNKAWDSAEAVRREWITALLGKKNAPKDAARYVAAELGQGDHDLRRAMEQGNPVACELLGIDQPSAGSYYSGVQNPIAAAAETASAARATMLSLATVLGAHEGGTGRHSWRNTAPGTKRYFTRLQDWGYPLSDVEQLVIDPDPDRARQAVDDATDAHVGEQAAAAQPAGTEPDGEPEGQPAPDGPDVEDSEA